VDGDILELGAQFLADDIARREDGDILQHGLAPVTKAGALTAATFSPPRSRLTTSVASASPSTSSAMISSGRPDCTTCSSSGIIACRFESFFSWIRM
jgi:hypothetical protein